MEKHYSVVLLAQQIANTRPDVDYHPEQCKRELCSSTNRGLNAVKQVTIQSYSVVIASSVIKGDLYTWNSDLEEEAQK